MSRLTMDHSSISLTVRNLLVPPQVESGATVGVVAPSGPLDGESLRAGIRYLQQEGFRVVVGDNVSRRLGYLAGTDGERCHDLNAMLDAPNVRAVVFARGGYGAMRILHLVDYDAAKHDPKRLVGMSDITSLQLALYAKCRLVTFSGPMIGQISDGLDPLSQSWLLRSLREPVQGRSLIPENQQGMRILRAGRATGLLLGGCLSLVTALLGTSYCPDFFGAILFLEDVNEETYRIDRMLTQLKLCGALGSINGLVLGHFIGPRSESILPDVERRALELIEDSPIPIISGYPHGHTLPNLTIPCGIPVELNTSPLSLLVRDF
jgi:muramoyltetrapeptide carboxypeptidase